MMTDTNEIIEKCREFLQRSSSKYSTEITKQVSDLEAFNGNFWTDEVKKVYRRTNKRKFCLHFSDWSVLANAIVSPYATSPWHTELSSRNNGLGDVQESINKVESDSDLKFELKKALLRAVVCGAGYAVVTTVADEVTGEPTIAVEFVVRQSSVALDPMVERCDASDAEEGAIVNYISTRKARRLYGEDVIPYGYPDNHPMLSFEGIAQWPDLEDCVQIVSYYVKNDAGNVDYYKICGNKVVESIELPIRFIPIIRFAGYEKYDSDRIKYGGIVDKTWNLQLGLNIAYSTLMERANRSIKANVIISDKAGENLDEYYLKKEDEDGSMIMYRQGADIPQVLKESFETGDLTNIISTSRTLIADVIGIPLAGIVGSEDKTATEILIQNNNKQSNVAIFYDNAYRAVRTFGRIVIELISGGQDLPFELENGPDVINNNMKHRQELSAIAQLMPAEMQPIVAVHMCDTVDSDYVDGIRADIVANLGDKLKLVSDKPADPVAIHQLEAMKTMLDTTMAQLEELKNENTQLKLEAQTMSLQLQNQKERTIIEMQKHQDQYALDIAKLKLEAEKQGVELQLDVTKTQAELADKALEIENQKLDLAEEALGVTYAV